MKLISGLFSSGPRRKLQGPLAHIVTFCAAAVAVWVVYKTTLSTGDLFAMTISFLSAMLALVFLTVGATPRSNLERPSVIDFVLAAASVASGIYFIVNSEAIINRISLMDPLSAYEFTFGTSLLVLTIEATRRTVGPSLTLIVLIFMGYNLFGHYLGGTFGHGYIPYEHLLDLMVLTTDGIFGVPIRVAATYVFLFVLFGAFLNRAGGGEFFFNLAATISGRSPGGPAKIAVVSSGLYGMISGSPTADVVTTGSVTIPMMRRLGYSGALAGGVEVAASTGGALMPPVMGSAAFIMAEYTGIAYKDIAIAAIFPALLYYLGVYMQVHLRSVKLGLSGLDEKDIPSLRATLRQGALFFVPLVVLVVTLLMGYSPVYVAIFGTISIIAVSLLSKKTRFGLKEAYGTLAEATLLVMSVTAACAAAGLVIGGLTMTGLATKFSSLVFLLTGSDLFLTLLVGGAMTILLGMGMPTPSVYILAAVLIAPIFVGLGIALMPAHLFILYYACMSASTPPVAVAAYAASAIAQTSPLPIATTAVRLSIVAFIVPFAFVYNQEILLSGAPSLILLTIAAAIIGVMLLALAIEGYLKGPISWWGRICFALAGLLFFVPKAGWTLVAGVVLILVAFVFSSGMPTLGFMGKRDQGRAPRVKPARR